MAYLEIVDVSKSYKEPDDGEVQVLHGTNLEVEKGEFVSLFGPNGCGKTTLLNIIAGLVNNDEGVVNIDGKEPGTARIGFVFQNYADSLFPWLKNIDNIAFSLSSADGQNRDKHKYVESFVGDMGLEEMPLYKYPYQCSAGQQQLVALVRELIYKPDVLLMDEPFVSLDYDRRLSQQKHLLNSWEKTNTTILFVSHEIDEAVYLSDRIVLLSQRPAQVVASYEITLARPRQIEMLETEEFFRLKVPILRNFREIIGR